MTDFERKFLEQTKKASKDNLEECQVFIDEMEKNEEFNNLAEEEKAALIAVLTLRANLEDKSKEPQALWRFIRYLTEVEMPLQFVDYTYFLFPDNEKYFAKILTPTAFHIIQRQAKLMLDNENYEDKRHKAHLEKIANGQMPYGYSLEMPSVKEEKENEG